MPNQHQYAPGSSGGGPGPQSRPDYRKLLVALLAILPFEYASQVTSIVTRWASGQQAATGFSATPAAAQEQRRKTRRGQRGSGRAARRQQQEEARKQQPQHHQPASLHQTTLQRPSTAAAPSADHLQEHQIREDLPEQNGQGLATVLPAQAADAVPAEQGEGEQRLPPPPPLLAPDDPRLADPELRAAAEAARRRQLLLEQRMEQATQQHLPFPSPPAPRPGMVSVPMVAPIPQAQVVRIAPVQVMGTDAAFTAVAAATVAVSSALTRPLLGGSNSLTGTPSKLPAPQRSLGEGEQQASGSAKTGAPQQQLAAPGQGKRRGQAATPGRAKARKTVGSEQSNQRQRASNQQQSKQQRALRAVRRHMQQVAAEQGRQVQWIDLRLCHDGKVRETAIGPDGRRVVLQEEALDRQ